MSIIYNKYNDREVKFLQIWVIPNKQNVEPRYDQISIRDIESSNSFFQILSPDKDDQGVWIHQDAWFNLGSFESGATANYSFNKNGNGVYAFVLEGKVEINGQKLEERDAMGIWEIDTLDFTSHSASRIILMEVPISN